MRSHGLHSLRDLEDGLGAGKATDNVYIRAPMRRASGVAKEIGTGM
jgi:hypothetical protein